MAIGLDTAPQRYAGKSLQTRTRQSQTFEVLRESDLEKIQSYMQLTSNTSTVDHKHCSCVESSSGPHHNGRGMSVHIGSANKDIWHKGGKLTAWACSMLVPNDTIRGEMVDMLGMANQARMQDAASFDPSSR